MAREDQKFKQTLNIATKPKTKEGTLPYIKAERRNILAQPGTSPTSPGELNYALTRMLLRYLTVGGESYQTYDEIIGALECAKLEFYRRKIVGYEDVKIAENGDVY